MYGSIIYFVDNYDAPSLIEDCMFINNSAFYNLIDLSVSSATVLNTQIINNTNNLFSLVSSNLILQKNEIKNLFCLATLPGCILQAQQASLVIIKSSYFFNVTNIIEEGNLYFESSRVLIESIEMANLKTPKKGSCVSSYNCSLNIINSDFINYDLNCINAYRGEMTINNSIFDNTKNKKSQKVFDYGSVFSYSSKEIVIFNSSFIENSNIMDGSAIYVVSTQIDKLNEIFIGNSNFFGNSALGKGTIYIYNQNFSIISSNFTNNIAQRGGGIYCNNECYLYLN